MARRVLLLSGVFALTVGCVDDGGSGDAGTDGTSEGSASMGSGPSESGPSSSSDTATSNTTGEPPPPGNFDERCGDENVIACWGFDTAEETNPLLNDSGFSAPEFDSNTYAEGGGAIRMQVLPGSGPDTSGSFVLDFEPGIGEGESLFVQWRQRYSDAFLNADFNGPGWKQMLVHENTSTQGCSDSEVVVTNYYGANFPIVYHACGIFEAPRENPVDGNEFEFNYQPGGDNRCLWSWLNEDMIDYLEPTDDLDELACIGHLPNEWITYQLGVQLNAWCTDTWENCPDDNRLQLWVTHEGQPPNLVIDWPFPLRTTTDPATTVYDSLQFTPYHTDKDPGLQHEPGELWYDSVIVSRARIAEPT